MKSVLAQLVENRQKGKKSLAVLIDPDKVGDHKKLRQLIELIHHGGADFIFVGGSLLIEDEFHAVVSFIKQRSALPVVLFPGSPSQISKEADAILFLSLISGRNAELLIGQHVVAAPQLRKANIEVIPTGYMLIDCGKATTASYISQTFPIPYNKPEIAAATALAGEYLGLRCLYIDGGSGAERAISAEMINGVHSATSLPLIVGGGIRNEAQAQAAFNAGADCIVIGTAIEEEPELLFAIANVKSNDQ
jgi:phosphoglycerol geranylgeranyltransferase